MIDRSVLLSDLQKLLKQLEDDLTARSDSAEVPEVQVALRAEYARARAAERTAQSYGEWRSDYATQVAVAWVLNAVFARFLEDNGLVEGAKLSGAGEGLQRARDEHEAYFRARPLESDREYLLAVFRELGTLPGMGAIFVENNPVFALPNWLSGDATQGILAFFQRIDDETGVLVHDFTDENLDGVEPFDTRFLGDLYQDLSVEARKRYALLQTPIFVEEFILDRTLNPAIEEFGLEDFRMIDPACGSGHFLLGAFERILDRWRGKDKHTNDTALAQRALDAVHGVDVNPYAIAISRFRLLLAAMKASGIAKLKNAPGFKFRLACGDSLLHGEGSQLVLGEWAPMAHHFQTEDIEALNRILRSGYFHAVVANPPYIVPRDKALNAAYRDRYETCHRQYSLAVPFMERIFNLATPGGFTGQITANSFMKREFGKKLIESFFPKVDLTHVIDTSGAYIPGHGTPTVILFGQNRNSTTSVIRTVMGIRGEPVTPDDASQGVVWTAINKQVDIEGSESEFVSVSDSKRELFQRHPWSLTGGGAVALKEHITQSADSNLASFIAEVGRTTHTGEDNVFYMSQSEATTKGLKEITVPVVLGENLRDYQLDFDLVSLFPYSKESGNVLTDLPTKLKRHFWRYRITLSNRRDFGQTIEERGLRWFEHSMFFPKRFTNPNSIAFAFVATHNHFVLDRGGKVFNRSAPVIKLPEGASEDDHLALLGLLNSAIACFWLKQVSQKKQMTAHDSVRIESISKVPHEFAGTQLKKFPIPPDWNTSPYRKWLIELARKADALAQELSELSPSSVIQRALRDESKFLEEWEIVKQKQKEIRSQLIWIQEEIDFTCYCWYKLADESLISRQLSVDGLLLDAGDRPFCILKQKNEEDFSVPSEIPKSWPERAKQVWQNRTDAIRNSKALKVIEDAHYKRRWIGQQGKFNRLVADDELRESAKHWLVEHIESYFDLDGRMNESGTPTAHPLLTTPTLISTGQLTDLVRQSESFLQVGELYRNDPTFNVQTLVDDLINQETVPLLPSLRYKPTGLRKRADWEHTWNLQRQEDAGEPVETIPVPPKYATADFAKPHYWKLRGKLDVPKERWVSFPHCEGPDGFPAIAWAGYDPLQMSGAIANYYVRVQEEFGGTNDPRLTPLLGCLLELIPWVQQWHNDPNPAFNGLRMGDYYLSFVTDEAQQLGQTLDDIRNWQPPAKPKKTKKSKRKQ